MLQPMQPMGQPNMAAAGPQAPKPAMPGMPQQGKPQGTPAGALMGMMPRGGIMAPIDKVADAYEGNPQALEQKALGNDLIAALAKQRLDVKLAEEERILKLQQAAQQGPEQQKTVIDQLDDRLLERQTALTQQEMQAEQMDTLKQKQAQQQQGQQRLMQQAMNPQQPGLPGLPAPNAAEPKAMAAGGIVAFAGGGNEELEFDPNAYTPSGAGIADLGKLLPTLTKLSQQEEAEMNRILRQYKGRVSAMQAREIAQGKRSESEIAPTQLEAPPAAPAAPGATPPTNAANIAPPKGIQNAGVVPGGAVPPTPKPAPQGAPAPQAQGLGALQNAVQQSLTTPEQRADAAAKERDTALQFIGYSPEDEAKRRENYAGLEAIDKARFDPTRMDREQFARTLAGGAGQSFIGGIGAGMTREYARAGDEQYRQQREAASARQKDFESMIGKSQEIKKEAYGAGQKTAENMSKEMQQAMHEATSMRNTDVNASVQALQIAAQRDTAAAMREGQSDQRLMVLQSNNEKARQAAMAKIATAPEFQALGLLAMTPEKDRSKAQQQQFATLNAQLQAKQADVAKVFDGINAQIMAKLNRGGGGAAQGAVDFSTLPK